MCFSISYLKKNNVFCISAQAEIVKLQQHLKLLQEEYTQLQNRNIELQKKYENLAITLNQNDETDSFPSQILSLVKRLHNSETYSDIRIKLKEKLVNAHKLVMSSRSEVWSESFLNKKDELDWCNMDTEVGELIILWIYKNEINLVTDDLALKVIFVAFDLKLMGLVQYCEQVLINNVSVRTCVKFYSVAEEVNAVHLREYCSGLISTYWNDLNSSDFEHMSGPLLYKMLKGKAQLPLHSAVRLQREDVVFLCLVENSSKVSELLYSIYHRLLCKLFMNLCIILYIFQSLCSKLQKQYYC